MEAGLCGGAGGVVMMMMGEWQEHGEDTEASGRRSNWRRGIGCIWKISQSAEKIGRCAGDRKVNVFHHLNGIYKDGREKSWEVWGEAEDVKA